ncbi:MAG: fatty acid desaturase CarF family protein [Candidatus Eremiobacterota bacterium]
MVITTAQSRQSFTPASVLAAGGSPTPPAPEEVFTPSPQTAVSEDVRSAPTPLKNKIACAAVIGSAAWLATNVAAQALGSGSLAGALVVGGGALLAAAGGYVAADLASGVFHHWIDNYPTPETPIVGDMAFEFQVHHHKIHDLEAESIWTNMAAAGKLMWIPMAAAAVTNPHWAVQAATLGFTGGAFLAQGSHRWTHMKNPPKIASVVQRLGLMQTREQHAIHHKMPWSDNYCIVNGMWNPLLTRTHFFRKWENLIYQVTGKEPHCWKDPGVKAFALGQIDEEQFLKNQGINRKIFRDIVKGQFDAEYERRQQLKREAEQA